MSKFLLDRRTVLRGLLGGAAVTVALPPLEAMLNVNGTAFADGTALPRRFVLYFWANGMIPDEFTPIGVGEGDAWQLSPELAPLADVKSKLSVVTGMQVKVPNRIPHWSGAAGLLTGIDPIGEEGDWTWAGPSIDQVFAQEIGGETRFRSLEVGMRSGGGVSFNGPNNRNPSEDSPRAFYDRIFGTGFVAPGEDPIIDPTIGLRRSVLDAVMEQTADLEGRVGTADKQRLDQHLSGIRDLETRLQRMEEDPPNLASCSRPDEPPADDSFTDLLDKGRLMADLAIMALACDQTRVLSYTFTGPVDNYVYPGIDDGHHQLTHNEIAPQPQVDAIVKQIMGELGGFVGKLDSVVEGDGTLLDNLAMLGTSGLSLGRTHSLDEYPLIVAGGACGFLKQGVHYRSETRENASKVMLSLQRAMGLTRASYGEGDAFTDEWVAEIER